MEDEARVGDVEGEGGRDSMAVGVLSTETGTEAPILLCQVVGALSTERRY